MKTYKYEMHCHTSEVSACGHITASELMDVYKNAGYDGVVVTDHFLNGSNRIDKTLPWEEKVHLMEEGYKCALERGKEIGLDVFYAWEISFRGTDFLIYGLDTKWLLDNPDCDKLTLNEFSDLAHAGGGYVVHAHPFREAGYIDMIRLLPRHVDAVETLNACRTDFENEMADQYADNYGLVKTCGTDNHVGKRERFSVLELPERAKSISDIINAIKENKHTISMYEMNNEGKLTNKLA